MGIRFDRDFNERISKIVRNYNRRVTAANKLGKINKANLPEKVSIKTLKKSYTRRKDLEKELKNLETFKRKDVRKIEDNVSLYDVKMVEQNRIQAIHYFEKQAQAAREKLKKNSPLAEGRVKTMERNIELLRKGVNSATTAELKAMERSVARYRQSFERKATGYRGFLSEVEQIMIYQGVSEDARNAFFEKLSQLDSEEFYQLYEKNDLINRIYQLADSPKYTGGKLVIHESDEKARELINTLMEEIDVLIADVKNQ